MASIVKSSQVETFRYVIGIDYGTTFTGVAWVLQDMNIDPTLNAIRVVNNWPKNGGHVIEGKVPSVYTYSGNSDTLWGYGIGHDSYRIRLSKLGLQTPKLEDALIALERTLNEAGYLSTTTEVLQNYQFPRHLTKSPVDVTTDYLTAVAEVVWDDIVNASGGTQINLTTWPIDFVITYPAAWNQRAISRIFQAATTAFERKFQPGKVTLGSIRLATESEACAQYTIRSVHEGKQLALNAGEGVVIVDAGGGATDIVAYKVDQVEPNIKMTRITPSSKVPFGATMIEKAFFERFLPQHLSVEDYRRLTGENGPRATYDQGSHWVYSRGEQEILENFLAIQNNFTGEPGKRYCLDIPRWIQARNGPSSPICSLTITNDDLRDVFSECVDGILDLINRQLVMATFLEVHVTAVVLSGGFSANQYLSSQVSNFCDLRMLRLFIDPDKDQRWTAVAKGAVLMGLGIGCEVPLEYKKCPVHIGVVLAPRYSAFAHSERQYYVDSFEQEERARDHIHWVVARGDPIPTSGPYQKNIRVVRKILLKGAPSGRITIITSEDTTEGGPENSMVSIDSTREVHTLEYSLASVNEDSGIWQNYRKKSVHGNVVYHKLEMQLEIVVCPEQATARLFWAQTRDMFGRIDAPGYSLGNIPIRFSRISATLTQNGW